MVHEIEVWVLVDSDGNAVAHTDRDSIAELYDEQIGGESAMARRLVKLSLKIPVPAEVALTGTVPDDGSPAVLALSV
jgi:hypothetical protein